jgi:hypothetical protein
MELADNDSGRDNEDNDVGEQVELPKEIVYRVVRLRGSSNNMGVCAGEKKKMEKA